MRRPGCNPSTALLLTLTVTFGFAVIAEPSDEPSPVVCEDGSFAILGPTLIDATGAPPRTIGGVVVSGREIERVVPAEQPISCPGRSIDAAGLYLIPGLWDLHVHLFFGREAALPLLLAHGVTGIRDMGGDLDELLAWRERIAGGELLAPRLLVAGPMLESPSQIEAARERGEPEASLRNHWAVPDESTARRIVRQLAARGVDFVKVRSVVSREVLAALGEAAGEAGLALVGHPPWSLDPLEAIAAGMTGFEHGFYPWPPDPPDSESHRRLVGALVDHGVALVPTLVAWEWRAMPLEDARNRIEDRLGLLDPWHRFLAPTLLDNWHDGLEDRLREGREDTAGWREVLDRQAAEIGRLHDAGVLVLPGTDLATPLVVPGAGLQRELALLVDKAGFTPMEALQAATRDAAGFLGLGDALGTVEEGKQADLVLLAANPLDQIGNLATVRGVVTQGRYLSTAALDRMLDQARARATSVPAHELR